MWLEDHVALALLLNEEYANPPTELVIEALQYAERIGRTAIVSSFEQIVQCYCIWFRRYTPEQQLSLSTPASIFLKR